MIKVSQLKRRRARAILAGGMVLGLGAAVTMAAWSDSEFASGVFNTGSFNLQGSATGIDDADFDDHDSIGDKASLAFVMNPDDLTPNDTVTAPFAVRLDQGTSYGAALVLTDATLTAGLTGLTYEIVRTSGFGCETSIIGTPLVKSGTSFGSAPDSAVYGIAAPTNGAPSETVNLCFRVTAGDELEQGATSSATWQLTASSITSTTP